MLTRLLLEQYRHHSGAVERSSTQCEKVRVGGERLVLWPPTRNFIEISTAPRWMRYF